MRIFIDADACPKPVREILYKAGTRFSIELILVANQALQIPQSPLIRLLQVSKGFDEADNEIVRLLAAGDLVVTSDIPLASDAIAKGAQALNPRGKLYTTHNIQQQLAVRDLMSHLRDNQQISGGAGAYNLQDKANFANALDKLLAQSRK